jgi:hypothetical protein
MHPKDFWQLGKDLKQLKVELTFSEFNQHVRKSLAICPRYAHLAVRVSDVFTLEEVMSIGVAKAVALSRVRCGKKRRALLQIAPSTPATNFLQQIRDYQLKNKPPNSYELIQPYVKEILRVLANVPEDQRSRVLQIVKNSHVPEKTEEIGNRFPIDAVHQV